MFGGDWTTQKLDIIAAYLSAYTTALKDKPTRERPFKKVYIDAFAGTGYRHASDDSTDNNLLFPDVDQSDQEVLDGSARRALQVAPPFDSYIFIEQSPGRCDALRALETEFPQHASAIAVEEGDANAEIQNLCKQQWEQRRAVLFLDPYGMQVDWETIRMVADTKAIDMWLLFPLGIGVNRLTPKSGKVPESWRRKLDQLLGTTDWYDAFYKYEATQYDMFGDPTELVKKASVETLGHYFVQRLKTVFPAVAPVPRVLSNSRSCPLYLLCFAAGNNKGAPIALRIANHLLTNW